MYNVLLLREDVCVKQTGHTYLYHETSIIQTSVLMDMLFFYINTFPIHKIDSLFYFVEYNSLYIL